MPASGITKIAAADLSLEEQAYRSLRAALMGGVFLPGDRLSIRQVAAALGTSPMPARAALGRLVSEQVLEVLPSGTAAVPLLTRAGFVELTAIRARLEPLAASLAAAAIGKAGLRGLDGLLPPLVGASEAGDIEKMLVANQDFMFAVYAEAGAPLLLSIIETLWLRRGPFYWGARHVLANWPGKLPTTRHHAVVAALRARDGEAAGAAIREEIELTTAFLLREARFDGDATPATGLARLAPLRRGGKGV